MDEEPNTAKPLNMVSIIEESEGAIKMAMIETAYITTESQALRKEILD